MALRRPRLTIPTRIFLSIVVVLIAFGAVCGASLYQHQRTAARLSLLHEGYLPLALSIGEAKNTQAVFATLLDSLLQERGRTASRFMLDTTRRVRPTTIGRALHGIDRVRALAPTDEDARALSEIRVSLEEVRAGYAEGEQSFERLFDADARGDEARAVRELDTLRLREQRISRELRGVWSTVQARVAETSRRAAEQEREFVLIVAALALGALFTGLVVLFWSQRLLAPLPRLEERVAAVARGDLTGRIEPARDDEIGKLTIEFERMVEAVAARDRQLREAAKQLVQTERLAAIGRMAAHVTHEVRNPLSSIGLNVELLEEEVGTSSTEAKALLRAIQREIDRLTGITEEYLRLARLPAPRLETEDVGHLVEDVGRFVAREFGASNVSLVTTVEPGLPLVAVDEPQIRQALLNLLRNAREAMPDGGEVRLDAVRAEGGVEICVRDQGDGIDPEKRPHIFEFFYSTKERGTGLGLPLTMQIVSAHKGTLRCEDAPGGGTVFAMWFPTVEPVTLRQAAC